jgi:hypothetical protein
MKFGQQPSCIRSRPPYDIGRPTSGCEGISIAPAHVAAVDPGFYVNLPADIAGVGSRCCTAAANYSPVGVATGWRMRANNNRSFCVG